MKESSRKGKGLGSNNGKKITIELWYEYGRFNVLNAYVENIDHVG